jgi:predicted Rdx family selenoprotein
MAVHLGGRGRQISEFEASLVYKVNSRTARAIQRNPVLRKKKKKKKKKDRISCSPGWPESSRGWFQISDPLRCWDYRPDSSFPSSVVLRIKARASCTPGKHSTHRDRVPARPQGFFLGKKYVSLVIPDLPRLLSVIHSFFSCAHHRSQDQ